MAYLLTWQRKKQFTGAQNPKYKEIDSIKAYTVVSEVLSLVGNPVY